MQRTVYYARVSTEEEHQAAALVTQCMENEEFINNQEEWIFIDKYIDEGKSGTTMEGRLEFIRMLDDMDNDKLDIILIKQIEVDAVPYDDLTGKSSEEPSADIKKPCGSGTCAAAGALCG